MKTEENKNLEGFTFRGGAAPFFISPSIKKAVLFLDALPVRELISGAQVAAAVGVSRGHFQSEATCAALQDYRVRVTGNKIWWGSRQAIAELKKRLNENRRIAI